MNLIQAIKDLSFSCPIFGEGRIEEGKYYYSFGKFARDVSSMNRAIILEDKIGVPALSPEDLPRLSGREKILMIHSGGFGDTITIGILLNQLREKYKSTFDICCHHDKWASILKPMGFKGQWIPYPPDIESLKNYNYMLSDLYRFIHDPSLFLKESPIKILAEVFDIPLKSNIYTFNVPQSVKTQMRLSCAKQIRMGINFDSMGDVKCYPEDLQPHLINKLLLAGFELFFFGMKPLSVVVDTTDSRIHDLTGHTNILELAALIEQMDYNIGVDSFTAHLSGILNKNILVLLSTTNEKYFDHYDGFLKTFSSRIECAPCYHVGNQCPLGLPSCRAFFHDSIIPEKIISKIIKEVTSSLTLGFV
jgi:Glycosyltransferase family 9 (heptosyltransferase)